MSRQKKQTSGIQNTNTRSDIGMAIDAVDTAQKYLLAVARDRRARQLSISTIAAIGRELQNIVCRMKVYDKD